MLLAGRSSVDKGTTETDAHGGSMGVGGSPKVQITKICCGYLHVGFRSCDRREWYGSVL